MLVDERQDRRDEPAGDRLHHRTRGEGVTALLEEPHDPEVALQLRHVQVEIHPIDALHLQRDVVRQHLSGRAR